MSTSPAMNLSFFFPIFVAWSSRLIAVCFRSRSVYTLGRQVDSTGQRGRKKAGECCPTRSGSCNLRGVVKVWVHAAVRLPEMGKLGKTSSIGGLCPLTLLSHTWKGSFDRISAWTPLCPFCNSSKRKTNNEERKTEPGFSLDRDNF